MSWPDRVYRPFDPNADDMGMVDFMPPQSVTAMHGVKEGLPEGWQDMEKTKKIEKVSAWDVVGGNPLYEAAAGALDIDWDEFRENFRNEIGEEDLYERPEVETEDGVEPTVAAGSQAEIDRARDEIDGDDDDDETPYDWGITHEGIEGQLNEMQDWLLQTIEDAEDKKGYSGSGPSAADWGMEGDIWEILGLDQPPQGPQPLAEDMFSYKDSPSNYDKLETYGTTTGYENPWIEAGVWIGENPNYAEEYPHRGEKGRTHVFWDYQRASGALTVPPAKGAGPAHDWYMADRERNMPGNDLNPDNPYSPGNTLGQGGWDHRPQETETATTETTTEEA